MGAGRWERGNTLVAVVRVDVVPFGTAVARVDDRGREPGRGFHGLDQLVAQRAAPGKAQVSERNVRGEKGEVEKGESVSGGRVEEMVREERERGAERGAGEGREEDRKREGKEEKRRKRSGRERGREEEERRKGERSGESEKRETRRARADRDWLR